MSVKRYSTSIFNAVLLLFTAFNQQCHCVLREEYLYPTDSLNRIKTYELVLTEGPVQPDNHVQSGYLINGQFPGPTIFVNQFDLLQVIVHNRLTAAISIHFHGILQSSTVASDGVPHVTQDLIQPNQTYDYQIQIGVQTGTYYYHGHGGYDIIYLHGAIVIRDNPSYWLSLGMDYHYEMGYEHTLLLEEFYHLPIHQALFDVKALPPLTSQLIKSLLINGYSYNEWPDNNGNAPGFEVVKVVPGETYRFRIINAGADHFFRFRIDGHKFRVIEADGILCFPTWTDHLEVNLGQRYSIMVTMDRKIDNYWIHSEVMSFYENYDGPANGKAILSYVGASDPTSLRKQLFPGRTPPQIKPSRWILGQLTPNIFLPQTEVYELPKKRDRRILIDTHERLIEGQRMYFINNHYYQKPDTTYLTQVRDGIDIAKNSKQVYEIIEGEVVDIIIQNRIAHDGACHEHPWHFHGHTFWIVADGPDTVDLNRVDNEIDANVRIGRLAFRDAVTTFPSQKHANETSGAGCGWTVIRFVANNPGIWLAHCHLVTHVMIGKQFVIYEYSKHNKKLINE